MKYTDLLEKLQKENKEHIVLMKSGIFFEFWIGGHLPKSLNIKANIDDGPNAKGESSWLKMQ